MQTDRLAKVFAVAVGKIDSEGIHLEDIFRLCDWRLRRVRNRHEAMEFLDATPAPVVIADSELGDGGWQSVLRDLQNRPEPPSLIVTSRFANDALWAEVLNMGGYDVLAVPLDTEEVTRVISAAVRHFDHERQRRQVSEVGGIVLAAAS
jgi:DNA-binding response OmpR family regulator